MVPMMRKNQSWLPDIFNDFFDTEWMEKTNATAPAINVVEHDNGYAVEVAAPGMTKEDFNVHLDEENNLVISMEKKIENKDENKKKRSLPASGIFLQQIPTNNGFARQRGQRKNIGGCQRRCSDDRTSQITERKSRKKYKTNRD